MKSLWLRIFLLCTFAYWGTGTAKFLHEQVEHHGGRDDALVDDKDDGDIADVLAAANAPALTSDHGQHPAKPKPLRHDETCFLCQQLSAMAAERSAPPVLPAVTLDLVATLVIPDWHAPVVRFSLLHPARGPPAFAPESV